MNYTINSAKTAAVSNEAFWIPIDENTPRGVNMWLISRAAGVSQKGQHDPSDKFFDHWFPNPKFATENIADEAIDTPAAGEIGTEFGAKDAPSEHATQLIANKVISTPAEVVFEHTNRTPEPKRPVDIAQDIILQVAATPDKTGTFIRNKLNLTSFEWHSALHHASHAIEKRFSRFYLRTEFAISMMPSAVKAMLTDVAAPRTTLVGTPPWLTSTGVPST